MRAAALLLAALLAPAVAEAQEARRPVVALVPKGATHVFWKSVEAGARERGAEVGVDVLWAAPQREDDRAQQMALVDTLVLRRVDALCLAPLDAVALREKAAKATAAGIPVVIFDSPLARPEGVSSGYVGTDNFAAGRLAAEGMAAALKGKGRVVVLRYQVGSASSEQREDGFLEGIRAHPGIEVVSSNQYGGATVASCLDKAKSLLLRHSGERAPDGVYCANQSTTLGMLQALRQAGLAGKVAFVGFDPTLALVEAMRKGEIQALVSQNPRQMGRLTVDAALARVRGQPIPERTDTGCALVTPANLDQPEIQAILKPQMN